MGQVARRTLVAAAITLALAAAAWASHSFNDVPTSAFYHDAVEWILNRGITGGCAAGLYCPDNPVTRAQMAAFLHREGLALTPAFTVVEDTPGALDPDAVPIICPTTANHTPTYPQQARIEGWVSLAAGGAMSVDISTRVSIDNGGSWLFADTDLPKASASTGEWLYVKNSSVISLVPGTGYRFAIDVGRVSGTGDATDSRCEVSVTILNRNGTSTPLGPALPAVRGR